MKTYYVDVGYACFSVDIGDDGICFATAPIAKWMAGKNIQDIEKWVHGKGGVMKQIVM